MTWIYFEIWFWWMNQPNFCVLTFTWAWIKGLFFSCSNMKDVELKRKYLSIYFHTWRGVIFQFKGTQMLLCSTFFCKWAADQALQYVHYEACTLCRWAHNTQEKIKGWRVLSPEERGGHLRRWSFTLDRRTWQPPSLSAMKIPLILLASLLASVSSIPKVETGSFLKKFKKN